MPVYSKGFGSGYTNNLTLPRSLNHVTQFLTRVDPDHWDEFQKHARKLHDTPNHVKIKPTSYKRILAAKHGSDLVRPIIIEHQDHGNHRRNSHIGGGIHEGILNVAETAAQIVGGETVSRWIGPEHPRREVSEHQKEMARLVKQTYPDDREGSSNEWMRQLEYDTDYGSLWKNKFGEHTFSIRGTRLVKLKDIVRDAKIMFGSKHTHDKELTNSMQKFMENNPNTPVNVAMHSLGSELGFNSVDRSGIQTKHMYAFAPASSPFMEKEHIIKNLDRPNVDFFLSANDPISKYYNQNLRPSDNDDVWYGAFYRNPVASHSIDQWI